MEEQELEAQDVEDLAYRDQELHIAKAFALAGEIKECNDPRLLSIASDRIQQHLKVAAFLARRLRSQDGNCEDGNKRDAVYYSQNPPATEQAFVDELTWLEQSKEELKAGDVVATLPAHAGELYCPQSALNCDDSLHEWVHTSSHTSSSELETDVADEASQNGDLEPVLGLDDGGSVLDNREESEEIDTFGDDDENSGNDEESGLLEHFDTVMSRNDSCIDQIGAELIQAESPMSNVLQLLLLPFDPNTPIVNVIGNIFAGKMKFEHFELIMAYHASIMDSNMILAGHAKRRRCEMEKKLKSAFISVTKDASLCAFMQALEPETATQTVVNDSPIVLAARSATKAADKGHGQHAWEAFVRTRCRELLSVYSYLLAQVRAWHQVTLDDLIPVCGKRGKMREALENGKTYFEEILGKEIGHFSMVQLYEEVLIPAMCATLPSFDRADGRLLQFIEPPATTAQSKSHAYDMANVITSKFSSQDLLEKYEVAEAMPVFRPFLSCSVEERKAMLQAKASSFFGDRNETGNLTEAAGKRRKRSAKIPRMELIANHSAEMLNGGRPRGTEALGAAFMISFVFATPTDIGGTKFNGLFDRKLIVDGDEVCRSTTAEMAFKAKGPVRQLLARMKNTLSSCRMQYMFADLTNDLRNERARTQMLFTRFQDVAYGDVDIRDKWEGVEEDEDDDGIDQDGTRNPITVPVVAV